MTAFDILDLVAVPVGIVAMLGITWASARAAAYLREKTHNERLARLADGLGRIAGKIAGDLQTMPAGSSLAAVKAQMISAGVTAAKSQFVETIAALGGPPDAVIATMIAGEIGKLTVPAVAATIVVAPVESGLGRN